MTVGLKILILAAFYIIAFGLAMLFGNLALKGTGEKQERLARFGRRISAIRLGGIVLIILGDDLNPLRDAARLVLGTGSAPLFYAAMFAAYLVPLVAFYGLMAAIVARFLNRLRGSSMKAGTQALRAGAGLLSTMLTWMAIYAVRYALPVFVGSAPLRFLVLIAWAALVLGAAAWLNHVLARRSKRRRRDEEDRLGPRVRDLASRAGVRLSRFVYYDTGEERIANAFASGLFRPTVSVYSHLERNLAPEEFDAIVAHELAHLKGRHEAVRLLVASLGIGVFLLLSEAISGAFEPARYIGLVIDLWLIILFVQALPGFAYRLQERKADAFAGRLVGSGATLASALRKVYALNDSDGSRKSRKNGLAHPALRKRLAALGDFGNAANDPARADEAAPEPSEAPIG